MKLYAPEHPHGCHIGLTNGHAILIPHGEAGIAVPKMFRRTALARGCLPVDTELEDLHADTVHVATMIRKAENRPIDSPSRG